MTLETKEILAEATVAIFSLSFLISYLRHLYRKKNSITILVDNCTGCPFKKEWQTEGGETFYNCNLKKVIDINNLSHKSNSDLNKTCPIKGKLVIKVS